jgi:hypothetical protein
MYLGNDWSILSLGFEEIIIQQLIKIARNNDEDTMTRRYTKSKYLLDLNFVCFRDFVASWQSLMAEAFDH